MHSTDKSKKHIPYSCAWPMYFVVENKKGPIKMFFRNEEEEKLEIYDNTLT